MKKNLDKSSQVKREEVFKNKPVNFTPKESLRENKPNKRGLSRKERLSLANNYKRSQANRQSNLNRRELLKNKHDFKYENFDEAKLFAEIEELDKRLSKSKDIKDTEKIVSRLLHIWMRFLDNLNIAKFRLSQFKNNRFYKQEYIKRQNEKPAIKLRLNNSFKKLLKKDYFLDLSNNFGKLFLYRIINTNTLEKLERNNSRQVNKLKQLESSFLKTEYTDLDSKLKDYLKIMEIREDLAISFGFKSFSEYARVKNEFFFYDNEELNKSIGLIKKYILPIHKELNERLYGEFVEEAEEFSSEKFESRNLKEYEEYYKEYFTKYDWEHRDAKRLMVYLNSSSLTQDSYPACKNFLIKDDFEDYLNKIFTVAERTVSRQNRGFLNNLKVKENLHIEQAEDDSGYSADFYYLSKSRTPILDLKINRSSAFIIEFLHTVALTYLSINRSKVLSSEHVLIRPSKESLLFFETAYELLALSRYDEIFKEEGFEFFKQRIELLITEIINLNMLAEFEDKLENYLLTEDQADLNLDMVKEVFSELLQDYNMQLYYQDEASINYAIDEYLIKRPFFAAVKNLPLLSAIDLLNVFIEDRAEARAKFDLFSVNTARASFLEEIKHIKLDNPLEQASVKKIAFTLVKILESLNLHED